LQPVFVSARTMLQANIRTLRAMTSELYPPDLEELGLKASLVRLEAPLVERGIDLTVEIPDKLVLDRDRAVLLYRVAREALVNVSKHSSARSVGIRVWQAGQRTQITVSDDGVGFNPSEPRGEGHLGLRILGDTIQQAGGRFEIRSSPGAGTSVTATFGIAAPALRFAGRHLAARSSGQNSAPAVRAT
jgi:two-component system, NarL family, sensor kinase